MGSNQGSRAATNYNIKRYVRSVIYCFASIYLTPERSKKKDSEGLFVRRLSYHTAGYVSIELLESLLVVLVFSIGNSIT